MTEYARRTSRVLLLNSKDRVLLLRTRLEPNGRLGAWFTPGGGIEEGEDLKAAAVRELFEETGLVVGEEQLTHVAFTTGTADLGFAKGLFRDEFFFCRVQHHDVDFSNLTDFERSVHAGFAWWSAGEIRQTSDTVYPNDLAVVMDRLVAAGPPGEPIQLRWHH